MKISVLGKQSSGEFTLLKVRHVQVTGLLLIGAFLVVVLPVTASALTVQNVVPWRWGNDTRSSAVAVGDVNNDGKTEIVTVGYYHDGTRYVAQAHVWNSSNLVPVKVSTWYWNSNTEASSVAIDDVDNDEQAEIVVGGAYFDGTRWVAQLHVLNGATLVVENMKNWYWTSDTQINSIAIGDVDNDGQIEIVTGGAYFDGTRSVAQLHVLNGATLAVENVKNWYWTSDTQINSVAVGDVDGDGHVEIITGGAFFDGTRWVAQLHSLNGANLAVENVKNWYWVSNTKISDVVVGSFGGSGSLDILTCGAYFDGSINNAQLMDWDGTNLALKSEAHWAWISDTDANAVAVVNDPVLGNYTVTCGSYYDQTFFNAQLTIWN
jgi:CTP:phosphocholine cytidylyltransferase-like protein